MTYQDAFTALADPTRRAVFEALRDGPRPVGDIAASLPVSRPAVSQHLKVLKQAGLVTDEADGTRRMYRMDERGLVELHTYIERLWDDALGRFKRAAEQGG